MSSIFFAARAVDESLALRRHFFGIFFAHGAAQNIRVAHGVAAEHLRDLHDLFLINDHAVGIFQNRLEQRMQIFDLFFAVFALDVFFGHAAVERTGPIERENRDQILEAVGPDLDGHLADAGAFQLEHAGGVAVAKGPVGFLVVERQMVEIDLFAAGDFDELQTIVQSRSAS